MDYDEYESLVTTKAAAKATVAILLLTYFLSPDVFYGKFKNLSLT
jgi:hypothetical protein